MRLTQVKHLVAATCNDSPTMAKEATMSIHASLIVGCAYLVLALVAALVVQARRR